MKQIFLTAAQLVDKGWTQGSYARDADGKKVKLASAEACSFCAEGAVMRAADGLNERSIAALSFLCEVVGTSAVGFNDCEGRTAAEVSAKLREAAARAPA